MLIFCLKKLAIDFCYPKNNASTLWKTGCNKWHDILNEFKFYLKKCTFIWESLICCVGIGYLIEENRFHSVFKSAMLQRILIVEIENLVY